MNKQEKCKQLGIDPSTAVGRLRKMLLFKFVVLAEQNVCVRCQQLIENIDEFSIEHIKPWLHSDNPHDMFFDLDNIGFSHLRCNIKASRKTTKVQPPDGSIWCWNCQTMKPLQDFRPGAERRDECKPCYAARRASIRLRTGKH